jgi:hypothetical protein
MSCRPKVLFADEPTTALDSTVQIQVLLLLRELQRTHGRIPLETVEAATPHAASRLRRFWHRPVDAARVEPAKRAAGVASGFDAASAKANVTKQVRHWDSSSCRR